MVSDRGFTLFELLVAVALMATLAAVGLPVMNEAINRNRVWTASELIGSQIRQARLKAISHNKSFRVTFNCPTTGQLRILVVTGVALTDNAADRCSTQQALDSGVTAMPTTVSFGTPPVLTVNGRGVFSPSTGALPLTITVVYGDLISRTLTVSATGQIAFGDF